MNFSEAVEFCEMSGIPYQRAFDLSQAVTFRIGGKAGIAVFPENGEQLADFADFCENCGYPFLVIGRGSNLLIPDEGLDCVIMTSGLNQVVFDGDSVTCGSGVSLTALAAEAGKRGLAGLEFAYGIPGSVGGAAWMNAGAYGGQMSDVVLSINYYSPKFGFGAFDAADCGYSYRRSAFMDSDKTIISVTCALHPDDPEKILSVMKELMRRRREKQPLEYPSAGSVFKRPAENVYAGKLIEDAGLKGTRIGGAMVSEKHAGFIVNTGGATCRDVRQLIHLVQDVVREKSGYELVCEIQMPDGEEP